MQKLILIAEAAYIHIIESEMRTSGMRKSSKQFGRGSSRHFEDARGDTPQKKGMKGSFRNIRQVDFDPKQYIVAECSEHEIEVFKHVFDYLDDDHDQMLTPLDLRKAIQDYGGYKPGRSFVYVAMSVFDVDDGGEISFREFVKLMTQKPSEADTDEDIDRIFTYFDDENKGYISEEDLLRAAEELHEQLDPREVRQMIQKCDPKGEGVIRADAFLHFNKRRSFA